MELKGLDKIDNALNAWLIKYGFKSRVHGVDSDFFWYHDNTIGYTFFFPEEAITPWTNTLNELGCNLIIDTFYSVFLHECFHGETYWSIPEEVRNECHKTKELMIQDPSSFDDLYWTYYHLPVELEATAAAVKFMNTNLKAIEELVDTVGAAVREFYEINDVVDENSFDFS